MNDHRTFMDHDLVGVPVGLIRERTEEFKNLRNKMPGSGPRLGFQQLAIRSMKKPCLYLVDSDMSSFEKRMESLINSEDTIASLPDETLKNIATAGFLSCGNCTLACYHCGCNAMDWQAGDDPLGRHMELQPNCPVIVREVQMNRTARRISYTKITQSISCPATVECGTPGYATAC